MTVLERRLSPELFILFFPLVLVSFSVRSFCFLLLCCPVLFCFYVLSPSVYFYFLYFLHPLGTVEKLGCALRYIYNSRGTQRGAGDTQRGGWGT